MQLQTELKDMQKKIEDFKKESERLLYRRRRLIELLNNRLQVGPPKHTGAKLKDRHLVSRLF